MTLGSYSVRTDPTIEAHRRWYDSKVWLDDTAWQGIPIQKHPNDLFIYQDIIHRCRPNLIIETGTYNGGSAVFLADMLRLIGGAGAGFVISIDVDPQPNLPSHVGVRYHIGNSSVDPVVIAAMTGSARTRETMVILDSDHRAEHVYAELDAYGPLVTPGQYLVVEDTNINGHPVLPGWGPGPAEALAEWLPDHPEFVADRRCERFGITTNPGGWLRRQP